MSAIPHYQNPGTERETVGRTGVYVVVNVNMYLYNEGLAIDARHDVQCTAVLRLTDETLHTVIDPLPPTEHTRGGKFRGKVTHF